MIGKSVLPTIHTLSTCVSTSSFFDIVADSINGKNESNCGNESESKRSKTVLERKSESRQRIDLNEGGEEHREYVIERENHEEALRSVCQLST